MGLGPAILVGNSGGLGGRSPLCSVGCDELIIITTGSQLRSQGRCNWGHFSLSLSAAGLPSLFGGSGIGINFIAEVRKPLSLARCVTIFGGSGDDIDGFRVRRGIDDTVLVVVGVRVFFPRHISREGLKLFTDDPGFFGSNLLGGNSLGLQKNETSISWGCFCCAYRSYEVSRQRLGLPTTTEDDTAGEKEYMGKRTSMNGSDKVKKGKDQKTYLYKPGVLLFPLTEGDPQGGYLLRLGRAGAP